MTHIAVSRTPRSRRDVSPKLSTFSVRLDDGASASVHEVTLSTSDFERLGGRYPSAEEFVRACFEFLVQREAKEQILPSFDVSVIGTYFPEFERTIASAG